MWSSASSGYSFQIQLVNKDLVLIGVSVRSYIQWFHYVPSFPTPWRNLVFLQKYQTISKNFISRMFALLDPHLMCREIVIFHLNFPHL